MKHNISALPTTPLLAFYQRYSKLSIVIPLPGEAAGAIVLSVSLA